jgi:type IV secretion system protein VirD4
MNAFDFLPDWVDGDFFIRCAWAAGILIVLYLGWRWSERDSKLKPPVPAVVVSDNFGTASYAHPTTMLEADTSLPAVWTGVFFGKSSAPEMTNVPLAQHIGAPIVSHRENHTLIVARTRAGKGTRIILPTLLKGIMTSSCICIDPKGENAAISARERSKFCHVHIINPWGELAPTFANLGFPPATYNPLDILDRKDPNAVAVAQSISAAICPSEGKGKDSYWSDMPARLLAGVLLWIADQPGETKTLARAREIVSLSRSELKSQFLVKMLASKAFGGAIREAAGAFVDMAPETYSGVMSNLVRFTGFLSDPQIKAATAKSSFSMWDLTGYDVDRSTTVYLVIPPDRIATQKTWLRLMIAAGMHTFKRKPAGEGLRCMFLIDEFASLGKIDELPTDIANMAGYGVDFTLIIQGIDQLKDIYGDAHGAIISNCAYRWFCNVNDLESAKYLSETLGKKTVQTISTGSQIGSSRNPGGGGTSEGESINKGETFRYLLNPDEVLNLGRDTAILLAPDSLPHYLRPVDYWDLQTAFAMYQEACPTLFWPMHYDANPYKKDGYADPDKKAPMVPAAAVPNVAPKQQALPTEQPPKPPPQAPPASPSAKPEGWNYDPTLYANKPKAPPPVAEKLPPPIDLTLYAPKPKALPKPDGDV